MMTQIKLQAKLRLSHYATILALLTVAMPIALASEELVSCSYPNREAAVMTEGSCGVMRADGTLQIDAALFGKIRFEKNGLSWFVTKKHGCYWLNKAGTSRKTYYIDNGADYFVEGLARYIGPDGTFGYMNTALKVVIPATFTFAAPFKNGRAYACMDCKIEAVGEHGEVKGGRWMIINRKGKVIK